MAGITKEKSYSKALNYTFHYEYYGNVSYESFYNSKILVGRSSFYNFTITNIIHGNNDNSCTLNCKICYKKICVKCLDNYILIEDTNKCQIDIPNQGYYYDSNSKIYKKCHEYCKSCLSGPKYYDDLLEIEDTNCNECIDNYYKIENTNNCLAKDNPPLTYYFDNNKNLFCKCFENCKTCSQNKINSTYFSCNTCDENSILYKKSGKCLDCVSRNKFVNYEQNECINFIPEGYYLLNKENNEIDKCYYTCKTCYKGGDSNDHKCIECGDNYPYRNKEGTKCLHDCSEEYSYKDKETKICYNDCKDNIIRERIYNYNNICLSLKDLPNNYKLNRYNNSIRILDNVIYCAHNILESTDNCICQKPFIYDMSQNNKKNVLMVIVLDLFQMKLNPLMNAVIYQEIWKKILIK